MKIKKKNFLTAALALPLFLLVVGCDAVGGGPGGDPLPDVAYRLDCFVPDGATQMLFEANEGFEDEGTVEGDPLTLDEKSSTGVIYREFNGQKGRMVVRVEAARGYGSHVAEGTFTVMGGNGIYASVQKEGDFYVMLDERGELVEVFKGYVKNHQ